MSESGGGGVHSERFVSCVDDFVKTLEFDLVGFVRKYDECSFVSCVKLQPQLLSWSRSNILRPTESSL